MATTLTATFDTRHEADMTVERLVQEHGIERSDIFIAADGDENGAGSRVAGEDGQVGSPSPAACADAPLDDAVAVSVDLADDAAADKVKDAFVEFNSAGVVGN